MEELFCGRLRSQVKCLECGYCSNTYETITSLSLEIRAATLAESLAHFTAVEVLVRGWWLELHEAHGRIGW